MFAIPFLTQIQKDSKNILLAGCGGGYDVFSGLPLYFELLAADPSKQIYLANLTFTRNLRTKRGKRFTDTCLEVRYTNYLNLSEKEQNDADNLNSYDAGKGFPANYFAEFHLSKWFYETHKKDVPIYTFDLEIASVPSLTAAFSDLIKQFQIDTVVLIDAGVDSVLKGDEEGQGTFGEDLISILALKNQNIPHKYLYCLGLSTEGGISEYDFFENLAGIQKLGGYLGSIGFLPCMPSVKEYINATNSCVPTNSSINAQIIAGIEGHYGNYIPPCIKSRLSDPKDLWINNTMATCYFFDFNKVVEYRLFLDDKELNESKSLSNLEDRYRKKREEVGLVKNGKFVGKRTYTTVFQGLDFKGESY